jgi:hypothetical protein
MQAWSATCVRPEQCCRRTAEPAEHRRPRYQDHAKDHGGKACPLKRQHARRNMNDVAEDHDTQEHPGDRLGRRARCRPATRNPAATTPMPAVAALAERR